METLVLLAKQSKLLFVISEWVVNESIWSAQKKYFDGKIGKQEAFVIINHMADIIGEGLGKGFMSSYAINEKVIIDSRLIIQEVGVNASDSLHVFITAVSGCEYFVTADLELIQRLKQ